MIVQPIGQNVWHLKVRELRNHTTTLHGTTLHGTTLHSTTLHSTTLHGLLDATLHLLNTTRLSKISRCCSPENCSSGTVVGFSSNCNCHSGKNAPDERAAGC